MLGFLMDPRRGKNRCGGKVENRPISFGGLTVPFELCGKTLSDSKHWSSLLVVRLFSKALPMNSCL